MHILMIDNYDSFTYNLVHQLRELGQQVTVMRNDDCPPEELPDFDALILSPGPGIPVEAGHLLSIIRYFAGKKPMLGICLGHQAIAESFGGTLYNLPKVLHGIATPIHLSEDRIFTGLEPKVEVGRYHSWVVQDEALPKELEVTARDEAGQIMALRHREQMIYGFQFHPESILTPTGNQMIQNFLQLASEHKIKHHETHTTTSI